MDKYITELKSSNERIRKEAPEKLKEVKSKLVRMKRQDLEKLSEQSRINYAFKEERNTKYWFTLNKENWSREVIVALENNKGILKLDTRTMADIAKKYHNNLYKKKGQKWT